MISLQIALVILCAVSPLVAAKTVASPYTPSFGPCPDAFSLVRMAGSSSYQQTLSPSEAAYINARKSDVLPHAWHSYLANVQATNVSLPDYVSNILSGNTSRNGPNLGIATSGGGYRAAIFGAGVLNALDGRNSTSVNAGTGGLLQAAQYLSGLSGGSWLVTSLAQADFPAMHSLIFGLGHTDGYAGWLAQFDLLDPGGSPAKDLEYAKSLVEEVRGKHAAGFRISMSDVWARALARHFVNGTSSATFSDNALTHGAGITFSGIADV